MLKHTCSNLNWAKRHPEKLSFQPETVLWLVTWVKWRNTVLWLAGTRCWGGTPARDNKGELEFPIVRDHGDTEGGGGVTGCSWVCRRSRISIRATLFMPKKVQVVNSRCSEDTNDGIFTIHMYVGHFWRVYFPVAAALVGGVLTFLARWTITMWAGGGGN